MHYKTVGYDHSQGTFTSLHQSLIKNPYYEISLDVQSPYSLHDNKHSHKLWVEVWISKIPINKKMHSIMPNIRIQTDLIII